MNDIERQKRKRSKAEAERLAQDPFLNEILDTLRDKALDKVLRAEPHDDVTRASYAAEARAIDNLRSKIRSLSAISTEDSEDSVV